MMEVVTALTKDLVTLEDIDLKTYFYPLVADGWSHAFIDTSCVVYMIRIGRRNIGYMITEPRGPNLAVHRLGILRQYRGLGAAKRLLKKAEELRVCTMSKALETVVPEIHCSPGDPDDVSLFLKHQGFRAVGIRPEVFRMYGEIYDGIIFER